MYIVRQHVPSNIPCHNQIIPAEHLKSQEHLKIINNWTKKKKMKLNEKKTKSMIFNFTKKYQFTTQLKVNEKPVEIVKETKLLGTYLTDDLKWEKNTSEIVKKAFQRMQLLNRAASFTSSMHDLRRIYLTFVRSILEQSAVVWHSSLTAKNRRALERVQKCAVRVILKGKYSNYEDGLKMLRIDNLDIRRKELCLRFAKNCLKNDKVKTMFEKNPSKHRMKKRKTKKFKICRAKTKRYQKSSIPYMVGLLNDDNEKQRLMMN